MKHLHILWVVGGIALVLPSVLLEAQDDKVAPAKTGETTLADKVAINAQIQAAMKERRELQMSYYRLRSGIERGGEIAELRKAANDAEAAARKAEKDDPDVMAARKAETDAYAALREAQEAALKANPEAAALMRKAEELESKRAALSFRAAVAELKLTHRDSPVVRALAKDPKFAKIQRPSYRIRDREARAEAYKAYEAARAAALAEMPEAKAIIEEIKAAKAELAEIDKAIGAARMKLMTLRSTLGQNRDNKALAEAGARSRAAQKAVYDAYKSPALKAAGEARDAARRALSKRLDELVAADKEGSALAAKIAALEKEIRALQAKIGRGPRRGPTRDPKRGPTRGSKRGTGRPVRKTES